MAASRMAKLAESVLSKSVAVSTKVGMKGIGTHALLICNSRIWRYVCIVLISQKKTKF